MESTSQHTSPDDSARQVVRRWMVVSVGALLVAGLFSLGLVIARMPPFSSWVTDPHFFKRALVVHVDLALIVWFYAFIVGLFHLIPMKLAARKVASQFAWLSAAGVVLMVLSAGIQGAEPVLANYVPVVDHPLFLLGLCAFAAGVIGALLSGGLWAKTGDHSSIIELPEAAVPGLRAAGLAVLAAAATFGAAWIATPSTLAAEAYYELVFWGGGHVLQVACVAAMVTVWIVLLDSLLDEPIVSRKTATVLFGLLIAPHLFAPLLTLSGTQSATYHAGATRLMQYGIFPVVLVFMGICMYAIWRAVSRREISWATLAADPRFIGFATSVGLTLCGFVLGAMIRGSNTMIPAHYHAAIGAVTVAFMTVGLLLLEPLGFELPSRRWRKAIRWQPALFGSGQIIFAIGFATAGAQGMARKTYGSEQQIRGVVDWLGLATMGVGGLIAIAGGLLFVTLIAAAVWPKLTRVLARPTTRARFVD
jgi:cytochrome c oxidase subunit I